MAVNYPPKFMEIKIIILYSMFMFEPDNKAPILKLQHPLHVIIF